jgi:hypothetical protein
VLIAIAGLSNSILARIALEDFARQPRYLDGLATFRPEALRPRLSTGLPFSC